MTKEPTKADLLKTIKRQDAAVRKLTKALNFEKDKLEASQAVAAAYLRQLQDAGIARAGDRGFPPSQTSHSVSEWRRLNQGEPAPAKMPWDCLPNPYEGSK